MQSFSPQDPARLVAQAEPASADTVAKAAARLHEVQSGWWRGGPAARANALSGAANRLRQRADEAAELVTLEVGKPIVEARGEVARAAAILDYYAQASYAALGQTLPVAGSGLLYTDRRPRGVAGLITPWNFPLAIPLWKAAPALACGNAVLLKPSPEAIGCAALLGEILEGLPFAVLPGGPETGQALINASDVVSFTGSVEVGHQVVLAAAQRGIAVQAEMGGQNAAIVLPDADPVATAGMLAAAAMGYAGQKCTATSRIIVVGEQRPFVEALTEAVAALQVGDPFDEATTVGPVISAAAAERVSAAAGAAFAAGARLLRVDQDAGDGDTPSTPPLSSWSTGRGHFVSPVVVSGLDPAHEVVQRETFGPLAVVLHAENVEHAVALANGVPYGLVTSIHGRDAGQLLSAAQGVDTGLIRVNAPTTGVDFYAPFGGEKASSYGPREQGLAALDFYSSTRTVTFGGAQ